jgi:pyruvate dehydrogenase E2 component (dihydrolipoyllysine-residue acetyltransferase)
VATEVILPRLGQGMESGTIVRWLKSEGDAIEKGEPLFELDTDKVTQEVEAEASGILLRIAVPEGEVPVGRTVAFIGEAGESVPEATVAPESGSNLSRGSTETARAPELPSVAPEQAPAPAPRHAQTNGRVKASPLARRIARERGVDLRSIRGTGPDGRVVAEDVERAAATERAPAAAAPPALASAGTVERRPLSNVRRTIARRLAAAWTVPAFQLTVSIDMTRADELVARRRELDPDVRITVTDVLTKACARALIRHRDMNVQFTEEELLVFPSADVGLAVAAPQGLVVPVVRGAERLALAEISAVRADLVSRARDGKLRTEDLEGGTFTISNLGMFGVEEFVAVLNPPQASILAVGATVERVVPRDGELHVVPLMSVTLTCDHRAVDGATGAEFLQTVKALLEDPALAL